MRNNSIRILLASISAACAIALSTLPAAAAVLRHASTDAYVDYVPVNSNPPIPAGLKVACMKGPNDLHSSETCPVVRYLGNTTWAYSYIDNRVGMALVTYDANNNVVGNTEKDGARYVWQAISSIDDKTVTFSGQANQNIVVTWAELVPPPVVAAVPANTTPPVPAGLKVACMPNGTDLHSSPTCPVVQDHGITTWFYSFMDNRVSMALVSYDAKNNVVRNVTLDGARY